MANYNILKAAIADYVKNRTGLETIDGDGLQQTLLSIVNSLGVEYQYAGIATPTTNPGTPDQNVFYLASTAGTYTNFGGLTLADGEIAILKYNGVWSKDSTGAASLEIVNQLGQRVIYDLPKHSVSTDMYSKTGKFINSSNALETATENVNSILIPNIGYTYVSVIANLNNNSVVAFLTDNFDDGTIHFCTGETGRHVIGSGTSETLQIPGGCLFIYISTNNYNPVQILLHQQTDILENVENKTNILRSSKEYRAKDYSYGGRPASISIGDAYLNLQNDNYAVIDKKNDAENIQNTLNSGDIVHCKGYDFVWDGLHFNVTPLGVEFGQFIDGAYKYEGDGNPVSESTDSSWKHCKFVVKAGDKFFYKGKGGSGYRLIIYKDNSNNDIFVETDSVQIDRYKILECQSDGVIYINFSKSLPSSLFYKLVNVTNLLDYEWENGAIEIATGRPLANNKRIRTANYYEVAQRVIVPEGYQVFAIIYYDGDTGEHNSYDRDYENCILAQVGKTGKKYKIVVTKLDSTQEITVNEFAGVDSFVSPLFKRTDFGMAQPFPRYECLQDDYSFGVVGTTKVVDVYTAFDALVDNDFLFRRFVGVASNGATVYAYYTQPQKPTESQYMPQIGKNNLKKNPQIVVIGSLHGNEQSPVFGWYYLMKDLCENYMDSEVLRFLHEYVSIVYVPCSNPYGFDNFTYWNANHVNLNRNWGVKDWFDPSGGDPTSPQYAGAAPFDQPETANLRDMILNNYPNADIIIDNHMRDNNGQPSQVNSLIWIEMPTWDCIKDDYTWLFYQSCYYHLMNMTPQYHNDYGQYIGGNNRDLVGTLLNTTKDPGTGQTNAWASQNNFLSLTFENFAGFPLDSAINTNDLVKKAIAENWGNFIVTACSYLAKYNKM